MSKQNPKVLQGNTYKDFPHYYDLLYQRFFKTVPDFINLIVKNTPSNGTILDLAAGTGEVTIPLIKKGYLVISLDLNRGMLTELKKKAYKNGINKVKLLNTEMSDLDDLRDIDTICIRQAINYQLGKTALKRQFKVIKKTLKEGGSFIFNAPNFKRQNRDFPVVTSINTSGKWSAFVVEVNKLKNRLLYHQQNSIIWLNTKPFKTIHLIDKNTFFLYTKEEFEKCLQNAGFKEIKFYSSGLKPYQAESKTLYCVAKNL